MGKVRGKSGITRLMAICITRGPDSPQRARALIRDHDVDVREKNEKGRTALHLALGARIEKSLLKWNVYKEDMWPDDTPISIELIHVLLEVYPDSVKEKNRHGFLPLHIVCEKNAPIDVIKLLIDVYPDGVKEKNINDSLPLHISCEENASIDVIKLLYDKYKEGASISDSFGKAPSQCLPCNSPSLSVFQSLLFLPTSTTIPSSPQSFSFGSFGSKSTSSATQGPITDSK